MPATNGVQLQPADKERIRAEWLTRLEELVSSVEGWAQELGWSLRRVEKQLDDSQIGSYLAPGLLLQEETTRILLEPIARSAPGAEGVADLYLLPAYDDIATLYYCDGEWQVMVPAASRVAALRNAETRPLTKETFEEVLAELKANAA